MAYGVNSVQAHGYKAGSGSQTAKLKSLAGYNLVWNEEAEGIDVYEVVAERAGDVDGIADLDGLHTHFLRTVISTPESWMDPPPSPVSG